MFGKLMSIPDAAMPQYYRLLLNRTEAELAAMQRAIDEGRNPRDFKVELGRAIVEKYYDAAAGRAAAEEFDRVFSERQLPSDMPTVDLSGELENGKIWVARLVVAAGFAQTNGEARRLVQQGGVKINDEVIGDDRAQVAVAEGDVLQVGKRRFATLSAGEA
jgi:tyrosyl-tRNA synthetase